MVAWRVAKSLLTLRDQWKAAHPGAANPGFIGDAEHATRVSDHNPWVDDPSSLVNVVTAGDFYHQPSIGADAYALADALKAGKDPRVKYVISRRKIWSLARDSEGWRPYSGTNPHTGHTHVSVSSTKVLYDSTRPWKIPTEDDVTPAEMKQLLDAINGARAAADTASSEAQAAARAAEKAGQQAAAAAEAAGRRWALYQLRYGLQTENERAQAWRAYADAIARGDSEDQAMDAAGAKLIPLDQVLKKLQENPPA